ncbi:MAG TPA: thermosome subunit alpha [Candidatus Thermoplasmatota archaeon]|nr:thermosome subunit alpha [Candidatus Thermoplasmatota archaeon]
MMGNQPVIILKEGTRREKGRGAQSNNILAAKAVAEAVRSTLGPKGMDKMLVDSMGDVVITNDGATILKEIDVQHPTAKMIIEIAKTQESEVGDGTTSSVVLAGALLGKAEDLLEDVHPTIITQGYRMAVQKALEVLNGIAVAIKPTDSETLKKIARTSMASKGASSQSDLLANITVQAVQAVSEKTETGFTVDKESIKIEKKVGGSINDTQLVLGVVLDKERAHGRMPTSVKNAKIALVNAALEIKKTEVEAKIEITSPDQIQSFLDEEERTIRRMVDTVKASGATVLFTQKGIDDLAQHFLAKEGIFAVKSVSEKDMKKLAKATGAKIVSNLKELTKEDLGKAGTVEERKIGDEAMTFVTECPSAKAVTILIRGGTEHVIDEVDRTLDDAIGVVATALRDGKMVAGAGAPEVEVALNLRRYAATVGGREQLAIEAFADAVEIIPRTLAENAGLDAINVLVDLRSAHENGKKTHGINLDSGKVEDMLKNAVIEPLRVKTQAIQSATEVATMILRIDDVIAAKEMKGGAGAGGMPDMDM